MQQQALCFPVVLCKRAEHRLGLSCAKAKNSACFGRLAFYTIMCIIALKNDIILIVAKIMSEKSGTYFIVQGRFEFGLPLRV